MRSANDWASRQIGRQAALVLGWRRGRDIDARRLVLAQSMDAELRSRAQSALDSIGQRPVRPYERSAHLEEDEVFLLEVGQLPTRPRPKVVGGDRPARPRNNEDDADDLAETDVSQLIQLLRAPGDLAPLPADDARSRTFLFYAAVFTSRGREPIAFVKHHNPASVLKAGRLLGLLGQTVTRVDDPVLVFEPNFDLVIDGNEVASLRDNAIPRLFADVEVAAAAVPAHLAALAALPLALPRATLDSIEAACSQRRLLARKLEELLQQPHVAVLTPEMVAKYLRSNGEPVGRFVHKGQIIVRLEDVGDLLDVLDQRHYRGGYDSLLRRADRASLVT